MPKVSKSALTPKLRFPEFRNDREWEQRILGDEGEFLSPLTGKSAEHFGVGEAKYITYMNVLSNTFADMNSLGTVDVRDYERQNRILRGDVLFTVSSETPDEAGMSSVVLEERDACYLNSFCTLFRFFEHKRPNSRYIGYFLRQPTVRKYLSERAQGSTRYNLSKAAFRSLPILVPSPAEQQKIAECLSTLDELIEAESRKLDALRDYKKGLMQQLFPREGETRPRLRFPAFRNASEWQEQPLEALAKRGSGHTPSKAHPEYYNGGIKWVSLADSHRLDNGFIHETEIEISQQGVENSSACLHPKGSVLLSRDAGIGKSAVMASDMAVSQHFIVWTCDSTKLNNWFLYHLFQHMKPLFERAATGSTIKTIGLPFFINLRVTIPSPKEQERIALCLNALDDLIAAQSDKLENLRTHKRGLMQQIFPFSGAINP